MNERLDQTSSNDGDCKDLNKTALKLGTISYTDKLVRYFYRPEDPSSLGVIRSFYGFLMLMDISEERGGSEIDIRWGEHRDCHFPLIPFIKPMPLPWMGVVYGAMWLGAFGLMVGYKFRKSCLLFTLTYWYILLVDKSYWNNHSYLFGICAILFLGSSATHYFSIDGMINKNIQNTDVPYWNYFILKFQFFLLYFLAGLKKSDIEWLDGFAMTNLSKHWVFDPFKFLLTTEQIDFLIVHWFGFIFDLTVGFWMLYDLTKPYAMLFCITFHFMNSRLFSIGMFPYVCLATMPLFCSNNWPKKIINKFQVNILKQKTLYYTKSHASLSCIYDPRAVKQRCNGMTKLSLPTKTTWKHKLTVSLLITHCGLQVFLPYSHFITKGYNNWTNGLYGYSWDMMVHAWENTFVVTKIVDNNNQQEHFLDPLAWTLNDRWTKHGDMMYQYANCLKKNLVKDYLKSESTKNPLSSTNFSIYIDVWCSLNRRFLQRMFNPNYDLLKANWSPFQPVEWLLPLLTEFSGWRTDLQEIKNHVYSWSNFSDVIFVADFPSLYLENYVATDLSNVTLTVLSGEVVLETNVYKKQARVRQKIGKGSSVPLKSGSFHRIHTVSTTPSSYMYTYINETRNIEQYASKNEVNCTIKSPFPILEDLTSRIENLKMMFQIIVKSILNILFGIPMDRRVRIH